MSDQTFPGYLRITQVLDWFKEPAYWDWVLRVGKKEARRVGTVARKIGSNVDEAVKADILLTTPWPKLKSLEAENCYKAWKRWVAEYPFISVQVADRLFNDELMVTGEPDILLSDTVIDIKTSAAIRPAYWLQTEFYARQLNLPYKAILRLDKNLGDYQYERRPVSDGDWEVCLSLIKAYRFFNPAVQETVEKEVADGSTVTDSKE